MNKPNLAASVRARLLNHAKARKQDFNLVLTRYGLERLLYRLSISNHADHFLLKGALLFDIWFELPHRPTRDADLLGFGSSELGWLEQVFREICAVEVDDGVRLQADSVTAVEIRKDANYAGVRITLLAILDGAKIHLQIDVGFGDAVIPGPEYIDYPVLLGDMDAPTMRAYPKYTVIAEKFEAICVLGIGNSRMKDYFDLWILTRNSELSGETLKQAIQATFSRRKTGLPTTEPLGLSVEFAGDAQKQTQWRAFLQRNTLENIDLVEVARSLQEFLMPVTETARANVQFPYRWSVKAGWVPESNDA
jgi:hypothetical protein